MLFSYRSRPSMGYFRVGEGCTPLAQVVGTLHYSEPQRTQCCTRPADASRRIATLDFLYKILVIIAKCQAILTMLCSQTLTTDKWQCSNTLAWLSDLKYQFFTGLTYMITPVHQRRFLSYDANRPSRVNCYISFILPSSKRLFPRDFGKWHKLNV